MFSLNDPAHKPPKDGTPILAWCDTCLGHEYEDEMLRCEYCNPIYTPGVGFQVLVWGKEYTRYDRDGNVTSVVPAAWELSENESIPVKPTHWCPIPPLNVQGEWIDAKTTPPPQDGTSILAWCVDECSDSTCEEHETNLCLYHAYADHGRVVGLQVISWLEGDEDVDFLGRDYKLEDWWFFDADNGLAANPTHWRPLPPPPSLKESQ